MSIFFVDNVFLTKSNSVALYSLGSCGKNTKLQYYRLLIVTYINDYINGVKYNWCQDYKYYIFCRYYLCGFYTKMETNILN